MGLIKAFSGAIGGTFADQWKDIITAGPFYEHTVLTEGILQRENNGRGSNYSNSYGVISNGSKIFVPENTAAFIFNQSRIEDVILEPGGYEYQNGQKSIFNNDRITEALFNQAKDRLGFGGQTSDQKIIAFVNLREIRDIKFGTRGPIVYNDSFYGTDLEIQSFGVFSLKIVDPELFIRNFVPPNTYNYSFDNSNARSQIISEFLQSFSVSLNSMSSNYRISQLPSKSIELANSIINDENNVGSWKSRFGFELQRIGIENIEFSTDSKELVKQYSSNKMNVKAYEEVSQKSSNIAAQQKIASGVENNGLGEGGGMFFGINMANNMNPQNASSTVQNKTLTLDEQIEAVKKLKDLLDSGILTQEEFDLKKKEIFGL